jgi:protocatechuate 3,4-dioxygenase alpha subunit
MAAALVQTPSQTVGPFFHMALDRPDCADLTAENPECERIVIAGRVTDGHGLGVADACLEGGGHPQVSFRLRGPG